MKYLFLSCFLQRKRISVKIEKGTVGINDVDISWIPQETLNVMSMFILSHGAKLFWTIWLYMSLLLFVCELSLISVALFVLSLGLQTRLPLKRLHGNEPNGQLGLTSKLQAAKILHHTGYQTLKSLWCSIPAADHKGLTVLEFNFNPKKWISAWWTCWTLSPVRAMSFKH